MLIKEYKILYLHPGKTGGYAMESALKESIFPEFNQDIGTITDPVAQMHGLLPPHGYLQHAACLKAEQLISERYGQQFFDELRILVTIRDPVERVKSAYRYTASNIKTAEAFDEFVFTRLGRLASSLSGSHYTPLHKYTHRNTMLRANLIIKLEEMDRAPQQISAAFNIPPIKIQHANVAQSENFRMSDRAKAQIRDIYQVDCQLFDYQ